MTFIDVLVTEVGNFLAPLSAILDNPATTDSLLAEIGASADNAGGDPLVDALRNIADLGNLIATLAASKSAPSFSDIASLLEVTKNAGLAFEALSASNGPAADLEGFGRDLFDLLVVVYLGYYHPLVREVATLLTLIDPAEEQTPSDPIVNNGEILRDSFRLDRFHPERLRDLVKDPIGTLRAAYWNAMQTEADADAVADKLFVRLRNVLDQLGVDCRYGIEPGDLPLFGQEAPLVDHALIVYASNQLSGADVDAGITLTLSPAEHGDLGLVAAPFGVITESVNFGRWEIDFQLAADVQAFAVGRQGPTLLASPGTAELDAKVTATLAAPDSGPAFVYGSPTGTRLEIGGALLSAEVKLSLADQSGAVSASVSKSAIVISPGDGDGFLQGVLPKDGLKTEFNLGIAWSKEGGLTFSGGAGLDATLSVGVSLGGGAFTIPTVHLGLAAGDAGLVVEVSASVGVSIGPVHALVDRLGLTTTLSFPDTGGNLGVADFAFAFKPPSGVGLAIDSGGVSGGGFLAFDTTKHEYSGVLQLEFDQITLQAFGLITTQVAGGDGYSLLALIDANFPPVQLGWGFTLNGVGGLLAVHRSASVDALRAALKADTLGKILFPKNAITSASQVLSELDTLFPTAPGRFLFGPMALIGWGSPTILTAAVAVIVELPEPVRIVLIARLSALLPTPSSALIKLNMDALGVLDLGQGQFSLDATLFDSRLLSFTLTGDMALRANWGTEREFLLAIGGFHPKFTPPADFPALQRLTINMPSGKIGKMRLMAYLAITSNTVQFGAELDVALGVAGCGLAGNLSFDALLQLDPFHFEADISGKVAITVDGDDLASIGLDATLTGPAPWNIAGKFTFHILWWDVSKSFSETWGEDAPAQPVAPVDVAGLLKTALADPRSWSASLPAGTPTLASIRPGADAGTVLAHPWAQLEVSQRIVPLNLDITRFGQAPPLDATRFALTDLRVGGGASAPTSEAVEDDFAPAQFFDLSDEEKLARPSFERHDAGLRLTADLIDTGTVQTKTLAYETSFVDEPGGAPRPDPSVPVQSLSWIDTLYVLEKGAAGRAGITRAGNRRYTAPGQPVQVAEPAFVIVETDTLAPAGIGPVSGLAYSHVQALLDAQPAAQRGSLQIVATHELEAAA